MKNKVFILLSAVFFLSGCLGQLKTREDLKGQTEASRPNEEVSVSPDSSEQGSSSSAPAYKQEERNEQMRALHGRVEEAENQVQELREAMIELANSRQKEKDDSAVKLQAYEEAIRNLESQIESLKAAGVSKAGSSQGVKSAEKKTDKNSEKDENPRADFQKGEEFFKAKKWKDAIVSYQKYRDDYPKGKLYPEATYQIGLCFLELGLKDESKSFFEEIRVKFPKSPLAKKAETKLKSLK